MLQNILNALSSVQDVHVNQTDDLFEKKSIEKAPHQSSLLLPQTPTALLRVPPAAY